jgi:hypothetical protein
VLLINFGESVRNGKMKKSFLNGTMQTCKTGIIILIRPVKNGKAEIRIITGSVRNGKAGIRIITSSVQGEKAAIRIIINCM